VHLTKKEIGGKVDIKEPGKIQAMFSKVASRYDLTNSIVSLQLHRLWNKRLAHSLKNSQVLLDLCAGTGEIAYRWLNYQTKSKEVYLLDFCDEMLFTAKAKSLPYLLKGHSLHFINADATCIPLSDASIDAVSIAYGIRNVQNPERCFQEVFRVLKPKGQFAILELTLPKNRLLKAGHQIYLNHLLPWLGGLLTREKKAYHYLSESVQTFLEPEKLKDLLNRAGFQNITLRPLAGGIATLISSDKV
jgi:demethylmenaquinone methyltransferase/2-methoxy-6-polyprenyl-1,4-benzoquinol methylase